MNTAHSSDQDLLAAHHAGDRTAFDTLWRRHHPVLLGYAARLLGDRTEAEEVVHDVFTRMVEGRWKPDGALRSWALTVVHRQCLDTLRRRSRWSRLTDRLTHALTALAWRDTPGDVGRHARLERALADLPTEHRAIVLLYYGQELPSREVAAIIGCDDQQVRSRLTYARKRLRELLGDEEV